MSDVHAVAGVDDTQGAERPMTAEIESVVHARPDALAVVAPDGQLTYRALWRGAGRLACRLRARGVTAETCVGVCVPRSTRLIETLVGVWRAGGAYVPLDPGYPADRLAYMVADAGIEVLVTDRATAETAPAERADVLLLDAPSSNGVHTETKTRDVDLPAVEPQQAAYLIYTSGSTGRPKGVCVQHYSVTNLKEALQRAVYPDDESVRVGLSAPVAFDGSVKQLAQLGAGHVLCVLPEEARFDGARHTRYSQRQKLQVLDGTPAQTELVLRSAIEERRDSAGGEETDPTQIDVWQEVIQTLGPRLPDRMLIGGEAISPRLWRTMQRMPQTRFYNVYGTTETTVDVTTLEINDEAGSHPHLGDALDNVCTYVLDAQMQPVTAGESGELYVGGAGVARGYRGRPQETAASFVPNPFDDRSGTRLYRTGDRVRRRSDGALEFLGRIDRQIQVRGHRIEPGEVEAALAETDGVEQAAVLARGEDAAEKQLVGYVVPSGRTVDGASVKDTLSAQMPGYMVPARLVEVDAMPLTANGKIDREALPEPSRKTPARTEEHVAPRTEVEEALCRIWTEVLEIDRVGATDDFFTLGGHSLTATQVAGRVRRAFGVDVGVRTLFEHPTVAVLARRIEQALRGGPENGTETAFKDADSEGAAPEDPVASGSPAPIERLDRSALTADDEPLRAPLAPVQRRLWLLHRLRPDSAAYHVPLALRLDGPVDAEALCDAFRTVRRRHEALRTRFTPGPNGEPQQVVLPSDTVGADAGIPLVDLRGVDGSIRSEVEADALDSLVQRPFRLTERPPVRAALLRRAADEHVLVVVMHHLVIDGWSMKMVIRELSALYAARRGDEHDGESRPPAPDVPEASDVQYPDYAAWQNRRLDEGLREEQLRYWRTRLDGAPERMELPGRQSSPESSEERPAEQTATRLPADLVDRLRARAESERATLHNALLAGLAVLLRRLTGQEDLVVATPTAGRERPELEEVVGFFVNTLPVRVQVKGEETLQAILQQVRDRVLEAQAHRTVPLDEIVEATAAEETAEQPYTQVVMAPQSMPHEHLSLPGVSWQPSEVELASAKFDWMLFVQREGAAGEKAVEPGPLHLRLRYDASQYDAPLMQRVLNRYVCVLEEMVQSPDQPVGSVDVLPDAERERLLGDLAGEPRPLPDAALPEQVARQAARRPDAVALSGPDGQLTYRALWTRAAQAARRLRARGVAAETPVGLAMGRGLAFAEAALAVLAAGGIYVPLDPGYPAERLRFMVEDAGLDLILTGEDADVFTERGSETLCLDSLLSEEALPECPVDPEQVDLEQIDPEQGAYLIYTSGSTGRPKAVLVEHRNLAALIDWHRSRFDVASDDRATQLASLSFDASVWETWPYLAQGATLHLPDDGLRRSPEALRALLLREEIGIAFVPTPMAEQLLQLRWPQTTPLRFLLTGGDRLTRRPDAGTPFALVNNYGPTEDTVVTTSGCVHARPSGTAPPIGRPVKGTRAYVLNESMHPVPIGTPGELYVGGAGLARGYRGRPRQTAAAFVPNPFADRSGTRLYRTGDRVRWRADGTLEFLGRADRQIQVRGHRIEPGEVTAALVAADSVEQAVVLARGEESGEKRLVAYAVPTGSTIDPTAVTAALQERLPDHLVPDRLVEVDAMPLTANGKIDRGALPEPGGNGRVGTEPVAPRTEVEAQIAAIWREVLDVERVGVTDDFFKLGGHSLSAMRVVGRIRRSFGVDVELRVLFDHPTIEEVAQVVVATLTEEIEALSEEEVQQHLDDSNGTDDADDFED